MEQSVTVDVAAPPARVWEVLSAVEHWPEWTGSVTSVRRLDDDALRPGARFRIVQPRLPESEYVVTDVVPGRSFTWVTAAPGVRVTAAHVVEPLPGDRARVRLSVSQTGWLGTVTGRFYRGLTERYLAAEAEGLRARSEGRV